MSDAQRRELARLAGDGDVGATRRLLAMNERVDPRESETDWCVRVLCGPPQPAALFSDRVRITLRHVGGHWRMQHVEKKTAPAEFRYGVDEDPAQLVRRCQAVRAVPALGSSHNQCCRQDGHRGDHVDEAGVRLRTAEDVQAALAARLEPGQGERARRVREMFEHEDAILEDRRRDHERRSRVRECQAMTGTSQCQLGRGHEGSHQHADAAGTMLWSSGPGGGVSRIPAPNP
jgi:hypothetical protein